MTLEGRRQLALFLVRKYFFVIYTHTHTHTHTHTQSACTVVSAVWFKGQPPVAFITPLQFSIQKPNFLFSIFLFKDGLPSPAFSLALPPKKKEKNRSQLFTDIITTEEHYSGRHSNHLTCALRLTGVIYFTALSLLKSFNIKQEQCHQLQLMLCFSSLGNSS